MDNKMTIIAKNGKKVDCNIVATFRNGRQNYVAYTDNSLKDDGKKELLVSKFDRINGEAHLQDIEDDTEWEFVESYLNREVFGDDFYGENDL